MVFRVKVALRLKNLNNTFNKLIINFSYVLYFEIFAEFYSTYIERYRSLMLSCKIKHLDKQKINS